MSWNELVMFSQAVSRSRGKAQSHWLCLTCKYVWGNTEQPQDVPDADKVCPRCDAENVTLNPQYHSSHSKEDAP